MKAIWSGAISFGLVNIPVNLYTAVKNRRPSFRMLRARDLCPIKYVRVCERDKSEVSSEEIVKGVEYEKGFYAIMSEDDLKRADPQRSRIIKISNFLDEFEIDPMLYEKPYYLEPANTAGKAFKLFSEALRKSKKVALGEFVLRNRESLVVVRPKEKVLVLNEIRFADQIFNASNLNSQDKSEFSADELEIATNLIGQMSYPFRIEEYKDTYSEKLNKIIQEKASGKVSAEKIEDQPIAETLDLMAKLKESLETAKRGRK